MVELKPKVTLKAKGDEAYISLKQLLVKLSWTAAVDLDLLAFYRAKDGRTGAVYYAEKGNMNEFPNMALDEDMGVGDVGGANEENLRITQLDEMSDVLIVTGIYNKPDSNFGQYDAVVTLTTDAGDNLEVPLTATETGQWCILAHIDNNSAMGAKLININKVQSEQPDVMQFR